jgi:hypothetical protein
MNVGTYSLGYRISNSTGIITYYRAVIDEVIGNNPPGLTYIYDLTIAINGASGITLENLNSCCISSTVWPVNPGSGYCTTGLPSYDGSSSVTGYNGYQGYFGYNNGLYSYTKKFKLTVTVGNECSSSTDYSYLYVNNHNKSIEAGVSNEIDINDLTRENSLIVFPNPTADYLNFSFNNTAEERYTLVLTDMYGHKTRMLIDNEFLPSGCTSRSFNISELPSGIYSYSLFSPLHSFNGLITKY